MEALELMPVRVRIASILRKAIYAGEYRSGDELSLTDVAARLGVSRTPVREAFQELAAEGLISLHMNKGAVVNRIDRKFVRDIFEMRILLEGEAAARAAENGMETQELLDRTQALQEKLDRDAYIRLNQELHAAVWEAAGNHQLTRFLMGMWNGPSVGRGPDAEQAHYRQSTEEHIRLLECIRDGRAADARAVMERHISRSMENILSSYEA